MQREYLQGETSATTPPNADEVPKLRAPSKLGNSRGRVSHAKRHGALFRAREVVTCKVLVFLRAVGGLAAFARHCHSNTLAWYGQAI
jgi:hypothetical protein